MKCSQQTFFSPFFMNLPLLLTAALEDLLHGKGVTENTSSTLEEPLSSLTHLAEAGLGNLKGLLATLAALMLVADWQGWAVFASSYSKYGVVCGGLLLGCFTRSQTPKKPPQMNAE